MTMRINLLKRPSNIIISFQDIPSHLADRHLNMTIHTQRREKLFESHRIVDCDEKLHSTSKRTVFSSCCMRKEKLKEKGYSPLY